MDLIKIKDVFVFNIIPILLTINLADELKLRCAAGGLPGPGFRTTNPQAGRGARSNVITLFTVAIYV